MFVNKNYLFFCVLLSIGVVHCNIDESETKRALVGDCDSGYSIKCFKMDIVTFLDKMSNSREYSVLPGVSVVRELNANDAKTEEIVAELARSFPNDPEKRLNGFLVTKLTNFLQSHTLRLKLLDAKSIEDARAAFTGRKGKIGGKKGGLESLLAAAMMMKGTLGAIALGALALLAGKALMTGLLALMLSAIIGLKALTSGGHKQTTYEIVAKPVYSHGHSHSSSHEDVHGHGGSGGGGGGSHSGYGSYGRSLNFDLPEHLTKN